MPTVDLVLAHPMLSVDAAALGLANRDYNVGERITVESATGWQLVTLGMANWDRPDAPGNSRPEPGALGESAYDIARRNGFVGSETQWLNSLRGTPGQPNTIAIGAVQTLPAGSMATARFRGESPTQVLDLGIPSGNAGRTVQHLGDTAGSVTLDLSGAEAFAFQATGDVVLDVTGWSLHQPVVVFVAQDATGGHAVTWPATFSLPALFTPPASSPGTMTVWWVMSPDQGDTVLVSVQGTYAPAAAPAGAGAGPAGE